VPRPARHGLLAALLLAGLTATRSASASDAAACRELERAFDLVKLDISSVQLNAILFSAAGKGCEPLARRLLAAGAALAARDRRGAMPLAHAAQSGQVALVELLLAHGAPIDARNLAGSTALHAAAENDRLAVVRLLLDKGADPNLPGRSGVTPLAAACFKGNESIVELLLAQGADPNAIDATGKAPILYAAALGFTPIVRRLLAANVDVNARYGNDLTALMWVAGFGDGAGILDVEQVVNLLIDRGASIDGADNRGRTALMIAAELGHDSIVDLLLRRGADRTLTDKDGKTARDLSANDNVRETLRCGSSLSPLASARGKKPQVERGEGVFQALRRLRCPSPGARHKQ